MDIRSTNLSVRAMNALRSAGYKTVEECLGLSERKLYSIKNLGKKTVLEIRQFCKEYKPKKSIDLIHKKNASDALESLDYQKTVLSIPVSQVLFSVRVRNCLDKLKVVSIKDLVRLTEQRILNQKNAGKKCARDIQFFLNQLDLKLGMKLSDEIISKIENNIQSTNNPTDLIGQFKEKYPAKAKTLENLQNQVIGADRIKFYKECFYLYEQQGTLESVAKTMDLTRERIRQILVKGTRLGLFKYTGYEYPFVSKEAIIKSYSDGMSLSKAAKSNRISVAYLKKLLTAYGITDDELEKIRLDAQKNECIELHRNIEAELGHVPSTTEMQRKSGWRYLTMRIRRLWGSIDAFRSELNIVRPKRELPEVSRLAFEKRRRLAFIVRMQNLDQIRECLCKAGSLSSVEISYECGIKPPKTYRLLGMLISTKEIVRVGEGSGTKYRLAGN